MTTFSARVGPVTAATITLYWGLLTLGRQFSVDPPWPLDDVWYSVAPQLVGAVLAFAAGFLVGQWRILLVVPAPVLVLAGLQLAGHVAPWHDAGPPLSDWWKANGWWPLSWEVAFPLGLGAVVRRTGSS